ncbi:hypothetical protein [Ignatzschineria sp. LJL83]
MTKRRSIFLLLIFIAVNGFIYWLSTSTFNDAPLPPYKKEIAALIAKNNDDKTYRYYALGLSINSNHCLYYINNILVYNSKEDDQIISSTATSIDAYIQNGKNEVSIRVLNPDYTNEDDNKVRSCEYEIQSSIYPEYALLGPVISQLSLFSNEAHAKHKYAYLNAEEASRTSKNSNAIYPLYSELDNRDAREDVLLIETLDESIISDQPNAKDILYTRIFYIEDTPKYLWNKGAPYKHEYRVKLIEAYENLRKMIASKNLVLLKEALHTVHSEDALLYYMTQSDQALTHQIINHEADDAFENSYLYSTINAWDMELNNINFDDYYIETFNENKKIRLVHKDDRNKVSNARLNSPITLNYRNVISLKTEEYKFNPIFSFIDGEFVIIDY